MQTSAEQTQGRLGACLRAVGLILLEELARVAYVMTSPWLEREPDEATENGRDRR